MLVPGSAQLFDEISRIARFILVGLFNTAIGYGIILIGLFLGLGDYLANAIGFLLGLPVAYLLHRWFTFRIERSVSAGEVKRYAIAVLIAFACNIGVVAIGRGLGYIEHPLVQLSAICTYAGVFYILSRLVVFPVTRLPSDPQS